MKKLGIIAGSGRLPALLAEECERLSRPYFVLGLEGHTDAALLEKTPHHEVRLGAVGEALKTLTSDRWQPLLPLDPIDRAFAADAHRILTSHHHDKIDSLTRARSTAFAASHVELYMRPHGAMPAAEDVGRGDLAAGGGRDDPARRRGARDARRRAILELEARLARRDVAGGIPGLERHGVLADSDERAGRRDLGDGDRAAATVDGRRGRSKVRERHLAIGVRHRGSRRRAVDPRRGPVDHAEDDGARRRSAHQAMDDDARLRPASRLESRGVHLSAEQSELPDR